MLLLVVIIDDRVEINEVALSLFRRKELNLLTPPFLPMQALSMCGKRWSKTRSCAILIIIIKTPNFNCIIIYALGLLGDVVK